MSTATLNILSEKFHDDLVKLAIEARERGLQSELTRWRSEYITGLRAKYPELAASLAAEFLGGAL